MVCMVRESERERDAHLPKLFRFIQYHAKDYRASCAHHNEYQTDSSGVLLAVLQHKTSPLIFPTIKRTRTPTGPRAHTQRILAESFEFLLSFLPLYIPFLKTFYTAIKLIESIKYFYIVIWRNEKNDATKFNEYSQREVRVCLTHLKMSQIKWI